jgi:predicted CoA-binding protein
MSEQNWEQTRRKHKVVTLVGSTKKEWQKKYRQVERELCLAGFVVMSVNVFRTDVPDIGVYRGTLVSIHLQKIDMADCVVVIDEKAIGNHTGYAIAYAKRVGKPVIIFESKAITTDAINEATKADSSNH